ncbi:MAG: XRE family transcriptional regulator [Candidatus Rokuibacteriota bacterium]
MAKKFRDLVARKSPAWHAAVETRKSHLLAEMPLHELRRARELSREQLAEDLGATQPEISKIERRTDMYVSTLRRFVEAMGGELEIIARFPDGTVRVTQFQELDTVSE